MAVNHDGSIEKLTETKDKDLPGPAQYTITPQKIVGTTKFGCEARKGMAGDHAENTPGPNKYNPSKLDITLRSSPSFGFGGSNRPKSEDTREVPGPGSYTISASRNTHGYSIAQRYAEAKSSNMLTPGPGTYANNDDKIKFGASPSFRIGSALRESKVSKSIVMPASNVYNPKYSFVS